MNESNILCKIENNYFIFILYMNKNILETIVDTMIVAQQNKLGDNKKTFMLNILKTEIPNFERYEPIIETIIDFIKLCSKNKDILKGLKNIKCFGCI